MSTVYADERVFVGSPSVGLTKLEWFTGMTMMGLLGNIEYDRGNQNADYVEHAEVARIARLAVRCAYSVINELNMDYLRHQPR